MSVPSDLILFHPARCFIVLKQFSAFCQSSDVSLVIHHFSFSRAMFKKDAPPYREKTSFLYLISAASGALRTKAQS